MHKLHRFWFTFKNPPRFIPLGLGCGITAYDYADAMALLEESVFSKTSALVVDSAIEDIDVQTLDQKHVIPNHGLLTIRGVWFPLGY